MCPTGQPSSLGLGSKRRSSSFPNPVLLPLPFQEWPSIYSAGSAAVILPLSPVSHVTSSKLSSAHLLRPLWFPELQACVIPHRLLNKRPGIPCFWDFYMLFFHSIPFPHELLTFSEVSPKYPRLGWIPPLCNPITSWAYPYHRSCYFMW